ncbi:MAG: SusD/RagB family nutrient-binding outer membrane lipoprotein [Saprospiraceae bacterium]|uniref:SusD/RagB family nutrient-binding outer membrane lipoprotein n=1 Tax=Candidatus Defluviibacterium haderslevense TaxID=2981993 RepID=A0A9D7SCR9_9BACT|nr:SusD/RagB family nutrient-binding outer membrane lipoprotein [Candidatus Defluviibacterium haderslevense]MBL0237285.1 SusD/RagB family nutrient-binding outer membrane lipoprotein [Candidatus Defluviibacterium haderslevense]
MKINRIYLLLIIGLVLIGTSCQKYFEDSNTNPNSPNKVPASVLLPTAQLALSYVYWGDGSRFLGLFSQHLTGASRQFVAYNNYTIVGNAVDNMWISLIYPKVLTNLKELRLVADPLTQYTYLGIADAVEAYTLLFTTDCFGDIPYSQALKGLDVPQPKFDSQEDIFKSINALLTSANAHFAKGKSTSFPGPDDLIYGGDVAKWKGFVSMVQARVNLRLAKRSGNYQPVLDALSNGGLVEDARLAYGSTSTANGPWYQYNEQRNDIAIGIKYKAILAGLNDPRDSTYGDVLDTDHKILTGDYALPFFTKTEQLFISAEAKFRTGDLPGAYADYLDGIGSSFGDALKTQTEYDTYILQPSVANGSANLTLEMIMTQKYIAMFLDPEAFADWRRTGIPSLTANTGNQVPRRLPYPETEVLYNANCPKPTVVNIFTRVWWDVN